MGDALSMDMKRQLDDLGQRIDAKIAELKRFGVLHGAEREADANRRLREIELTSFARGGTAKLGALAEDIEILRLTLERWLARVDHAAECDVEVHTRAAKQKTGLPR